MEMRNSGSDYLMDCLKGKESFPFPGLHFNPTDVELVMFFLMKKLMGRKFCEVIAELDVYKFAPEKLQDKSILKGDLIWYFFCPIVKKYLAGDKMNRSTEDGHWKITGNDRHVLHDGKRVGSIKSLIFYKRKEEEEEERTDWVMHEYRLDKEFLAERGFAQGKHVLCKVFQKAGQGPRNGAQYGAPFKESDWNDDKEVGIVEAVRSSGLSISAAVLPNNHSSSLAAGTSQLGGTVSESCLSETVLSQYELHQSLGGAGTSQWEGTVSESHLSEHELIPAVHSNNVVSKELDQALGGCVPFSTSLVSNEDKKNKKPIHDGTAEVAPPLDESRENGLNLRDLEGPSQNVSHDGTAVATSPFDESVFEGLEDLDNSICLADLADTSQRDFSNKGRKRKRTENEN